MGLFDFAASVGTSLKKAIGVGDDETTAQELTQALRDSGVSIEKGTVTVQSDTVIVTGQASNQAEREKTVLILGNTKGVARVDDRMTLAPQAGTTEAASQSTFYTVKSGDTLSKLAKQFYGDASRYPELFEANRPMLKDPDEIYPGQVLRIPQAKRH